MKNYSTTLLLILLYFCWVAPSLADSQITSPPAPEDMREEQIIAEKNRHDLERQARQTKEAAAEEARLSRERITGDRASLELALAELEKEIKSLEEAIVALEHEGKNLLEQETALSEELAATDAVIHELIGVIRMFAKDTAGHLGNSLQSALSGGIPQLLFDIADQGRFPGIAEINNLIDILWRQLNSSGSVRVEHGQIVDRSGTNQNVDILVIGDFTAAYRSGDETGYLSPAPADGKLFALTNLPPRRVQRQLNAYMSGETDSVPLDISRGGAINQLAHELSTWQQIAKGGPLIWPIIALFGAALIIIAERVIFLWRTRLPADSFAERIAKLAAEQNWQGCRDECRQLAAKPLARVLAAGLNCYKNQRKTMENALQEAILREVPPLERFLSTLGMLAAIAPLLGLLGTVTGMISTFDVITRYGTGDPRMMSGGISEALVTTMLGLSAAIPIMLVHTLLNRTIDNRIAHMEEKAMALVNLVEKNHHGTA